MNFDFKPQQHSEPLSLSKPIGESILEEKFYHVSIRHKSTMTYSIELDMVDFMSF